MKFPQKMVDFFILWMLKVQPDTGYGMIARMKEGGVPMPGAQMYPILNSLNEQKLIKKVPEKEGKRVKYRYYITQNGLQDLHEMKKGMSPLKRECLAYMLKR